MIRALLVIIFSTFLSVSHGQSSEESYYLERYRCRLGEGCRAFGDDIRQDFAIMHDTQTLRWSKHLLQKRHQATIRKVTDTYVIGLAGGLYTFADLQTGALYTIDYNRSNYELWGFGPDTTLVRSNTRAMMQLLEDHKTQKDVMQFLINQTK